MKPHCALIERVAPEHGPSEIDVGGGESTVIDDLLANGCENIAVLDISQAAIDANRRRLGQASDRDRWLVADVNKVELESHGYDVWHDRAVFHFLTTASDRASCIEA